MSHGAGGRDIAQQVCDALDGAMSVLRRAARRGDVEARRALAKCQQARAAATYPASGAVRANPALIIYGNPPRRGGGDGVMSRDVQAIIYVHADDGASYVHGFGNAELDLSTRGDRLTIGGLREQTGVVMTAQRDGTIALNQQDGRPLWREF